MNSESQPLLPSTNQDVRNRRLRPLSCEEVQASRQEVKWTRARCVLIALFWAIIVMTLSMIACILLTTPKCGDKMATMTTPSVPPVHLTLAPLISQGRAVNDILYTL